MALRESGKTYREIAERISNHKDSTKTLSVTRVSQIVDCAKRQAALRKPGGEGE